MSNLKELGVVTIGQAPRVDLVPEIISILHEDVRIIEKGALDGLSVKEVEAFYPGEGDEVLVTRMADGASVTVAERYIFPRLKHQVESLELAGVKVILIACTGEFPPFGSSSLVVYPQKVLHHVVVSLAQGLKLGVLVPDELQVASAKQRWSSAAREVIAEAASPYAGLDGIERAAESLSMSGVDLVAMDCMGYTVGMKDLLSRRVQKPVVLARSIAAKVVGELL